MTNRPSRSPIGRVWPTVVPSPCTIRRRCRKRVSPWAAWHVHVLSQRPVQLWASRSSRRSTPSRPSCRCCRLSRCCWSERRCCRDADPPLAAAAVDATAPKKVAPPTDVPDQRTEEGDCGRRDHALPPDTHRHPRSLCDGVPRAYGRQALARPETGLRRPEALDARNGRRRRTALAETKQGSSRHRASRIVIGQAQPGFGSGHTSPTGWSSEPRVGLSGTQRWKMARSMQFRLAGGHSDGQPRGTQRSSFRPSGTEPGPGSGHAEQQYHCCVAHVCGVRDRRTRASCCITPR